jgi:lipoate-protein ligase A
MWRILLSPAASGADNMALDEALMLRARHTGEWTLRVYSWIRPTLSLGRNQTARGGYRLPLLHERGISVVRRPTGGRAILHDREVTYSVTGPVGGAGELSESYDRINRLLVAGLRTLGIGATVVARATDVEAVAGKTADSQPGLIPCFHHPSRGEITLGGRKLAGSAQWRRDGALLQHGSILVDDDQMQLASLSTNAGEAVPPAATLRHALGRAPTIGEVADALFDAVRALEDSGAADLQIDRQLEEATHTLRAHYLDDSWTWRR